jgi:hypothetical protein
VDRGGVSRNGDFIGGRDGNGAILFADLDDLRMDGRKSER